MEILSETARQQVTRTIGHVALNYRNTGEGPLAAQLLQRLGFHLVQDIPLPGGERFYQFLVDGKAGNKGDGIIYLAPLPAADRALFAAIHEALGVGTTHEHPALGPFRTAQANDPEHGFHVGLLVDSLEWIEETMLTLQELADSDTPFKNRLKFLCNRAPRGAADIDERLDSSPLFSRTPRFIYGRNAVQAFIETDILSAGPLGEKMVIELDYVFPGYPDNMFTATIL